MTATYHSKTTYLNANPATVYTFQHPVVGRSSVIVNLCLFGDSNSDSVSTVKIQDVINGSTQYDLTKAAESTAVWQDGTAPPYMRTSSWYIGDITSGIKQIEVTASSGVLLLSASALNYRNTDRSAPVSGGVAAFSDNGYAGGTNLENMAITVASAVGDLALAATAFYSALGSPPYYDIGASEIERDLSGNGGGYLLCLEKAGASSVSFSDDINTGDPLDKGWSEVACSLKSKTEVYAPAFYRAITLSQPTSDLTDFPVWFHGTYSYLKTEANGGKVKNSDGRDIMFWADTSFTTPLSVDIRSWDASSGAISAMVKCDPTSATPKVIYLSYGDSTVVYDQSDRPGTYNSNTVAVWPLDDTSTSVGCRTGTVNMAAYPLASPTFGVTGQLGTGITFAKASLQFLEVTYAALTTADPLKFANTSHFGAAMWLKLTDTAAQYALLCNLDSTQQYNGWQFTHDSGGKLGISMVSNVGGGDYLALVTTNVVLDTNWHHVAFTYDGSKTVAGVKLYVDGAVISAITNQHDALVNNLTSTARPITIGERGAFGSGDLHLNGTLDEISVYRTDYPAAWFKALYDSQNGTYYTVGDESSPNDGVRARGRTVGAC